MITDKKLCVAVLLGSLLVADVAQAHEIGTTRVVVSFPTADTYVVEITADASAILARLEAAAHRPRSGTLTADEYEQRIDALQQEFLARALVSFDGARSWPRFEYLKEPVSAAAEAALTPPGAIVKLTGAIPAHARSLAWRYDLTVASYALTIKSANGNPDRTVWLEGSQASQALSLTEHVPSPSRLQIAGDYFALGFTHILPKGLDHILFVLGIFLFSRRLKPMLWQISAFTVAHSITLGLTLYGLVSLPPSIVEPLIAMSIVYVAVENIVTADLKPWRVALVFGFGLLHGMGFAGVLRELGLPRSEFLTGLVTFNAGVEAGQLTIIVLASIAVFQWQSNRAVYRRLVVVPGSLLIALTGLYWTVERLRVW